jgi:hypothetical protein
MSDDPIDLGALSPKERKEVIESLQRRLYDAFAESRNAAWELAKYLFTANAGAAAGVFVLVRDRASDGSLVPAFFCFCLGVVSVGLAYFFGAVGFSTTAKGFEADVLKVFDGKMSLTDMSESQKQRVRGFASRLVPFFGLISFLCLLGGGGLSIRPFLGEKPVAPSQLETTRLLEPSTPIVTSATNLVDRATNR